MKTMSDTKKNLILLSGIIILITMLSYIPAMRGGYIWDDDHYITENTNLRTLDGLRKIWLEPKVLPQYYPLVHTSFWVEYHLWQLHPFGYHLVNVLLHALNAILLLIVLRYLRVQGAWLAALIFALHPVQVESVAWITERKNVLSGLFYLCSFLAYLRFCNLAADPEPTSISPSMHPSTTDAGGHCWRFYALSLFLFLCALLSKTVTSSLPAAILLMLWWQRDRIRWRHIFPLIPFFVVGVALGLTTVWLEKYHVGAQGEEWALSFVDRVLVAGRALWFYAGKLVWPYELTFTYPRWQIDAGAWWQYLFPLAAVAVIFILWLLRQRLGKGPLVAVLFFAGTLFPALGFFDVYPMRFSFVADHFQYLASIGLISLFSASISIFFIRLGSSYRNLGFVACFGALLALGLGVWKQGSIYRDAEMLYRDTIAKNPNAWMAHNNLGVLLEQDGSVATAMTHYATALRIKPDYAIAHLNIAEVLALQGKFDEAIAHSLEALRLKPDYPNPHNSLGLFYARQGKIDEAVAHFSQALRMKPDYANPHNNLGALLARQGKLDEAIAHFSEALRILPDYAKAHNNLGEALFRQGKIDEAMTHLYLALQIEPEYADPHINLGTLLAGQGKLDEATAHFSEALQIEPNSVEAHNNMGMILARQGKFEDAVAHFSQALLIEPDSARVRRNLERVLQQANKSASESSQTSRP